ncbi:hypothetical protein GCM10009540_54420 [Streptomyces turgidiscabies]
MHVGCLSLWVVRCVVGAGPFSLAPAAPTRPILGGPAPEPPLLKLPHRGTPKGLDDAGRGLIFQPVRRLRTSAFSAKRGLGAQPPEGMGRVGAAGARKIRTG